MLIFGNMADDNRKKMAIALECLAIDNPRSPKEYIANLMTWDVAELEAYLGRRRSEQASMSSSRFRPHP